MMRVAQATLRLDPAAIMAALADWDSRPKWRPGLLRVLHPSDERILSGSAWVEERALSRKALHLSARTIEVDWPHTVSYALEGDGLEARLRWQATADASGTVVRQDVQARATKLNTWLSGAAGSFPLQQLNALEALRRHLGLQPRKQVP